MVKKEWSIIVSLKNRTSIIVDYQEIPLRVLQRNNLILSNIEKKQIQTTKDNKIVLNLLLNFFESLEKIKNDDEVFEIIIVDFNSDDYNLDLLHSKYKKLNIKIVKIDDYFSRGRGLNVGYQNSTKDNIFFADADMLLTDRNLFDCAYLEINNGKAFFPICFGLCEPSHQIGYLRNSGYGLSMMSREIIDKYNLKFPEFNSLGKEDEDFFDKLNKYNLCSRYVPTGYFHQWHPESQIFKNKFYKYSDIKKTKIFVNCDNLMLDNNDIVLIKKFISSNLNINDEYYLTHELEKYVSIVINVNKYEKYKVATDEEINNYIKKHNKSLKQFSI